MFVMQHFRLSWDDALQYVQNRRYCISPNGGFLTQLKVCLASSVLDFWKGHYQRILITHTDLRNGNQSIERPKPLLRFHQQSHR